MKIDKICFHYFDKKLGEVVRQYKYNIFYHNAKVLLAEDIAQGIAEVMLWDRIQAGELLAF